MAVAVTGTPNVQSNTASGSSKTLTFPSATYGPGEILTVDVLQQQGSVALPIPAAPSGGGLTWTQIANASGAGSDFVRVTSWWAHTGAGGTYAVTQVTTRTAPAALSTQGVLTRHTGCNTSNPIGQVDTYVGKVTDPLTSNTNMQLTNVLAGSMLHAGACDWSAQTTVTLAFDSSIADTEAINALESGQAHFCAWRSTAALGANDADVRAGADASGATGNWAAVFYELLQAGSTPNDGDASGTIDWVGSATGTTQRRGAATGAIGWVGSSSGVQVPKGAASGTVAWVGEATGVAPALTPNDGAATGAVDWVGTATGTSSYQGSATGAISWVGTATGTATHQGSASGTVAWVGSATGSATHNGAATGSVTWAGAATGATARQGAATGAVTWAGAADGTAPLLAQDGTANGDIAWAGVATGTSSYQGGATGTITWAGTADGQRASAGAAVGTVTWVGIVDGITLRQGAAVGTVTWVGVVVGQSEPPPTLIIIGARTFVDVTQPRAIVDVTDDRNIEEVFP